MSYPVSYFKKRYNKSELTPQQIAFCEAYLSGESASKSARIAGYKSESRASNYLLRTKRIKDYLASQHKRFAFVKLTLESKLNKLAHIIDRTIPDDDNLPCDYNTGIKAIAEANKIQGHYAPTQNQNLNVSVKTDVDTAKSIADGLNKLDRYKQDF